MRGLRWGVRVLGEVLITLGLLLFHPGGLAAPVDRRDGQPRTSEHHPGAREGFRSGRTSRAACRRPLATLTKVPFGQAFAVVRIPRFGADYARPVLEGTDRDTLIKGMGHYSGTAFPG